MDSPSRTAVRSCNVPGCANAYCVRGLCRSHYDRFRRTGSPAADIPFDEWAPGLPGNPWAGRQPCPACASSRWTMPADGQPSSSRWVCVARQHTTLFFAVAEVIT